MVSNDVFLFSQAATKKQKYEKISERKMSTPVEVLCKVSIGIVFGEHSSGDVVNKFKQAYPT